MFEFVSKALLSLVLDKRARDALDVAKIPDRPAAGSAAAGRAAPRAASQEKAPPTMTDQRRELIRKALDVQRSKQHVFDELSEDAKVKLMITAARAMRIPPDELERSLSQRRRPGGGKP